MKLKNHEIVGDDANSLTSNNIQQLDLLSACGPPPRRDRPGYRRRQIMRARAAWYFQQMRRLVDAAVDWKPAPPARPEQTALDLRRETEVHLAK